MSAAGPTPDPPMANELVTFVQHRLPGLDDGVYRLTVSQHVDDSSGNPISGDDLSNTYKFAVLGDRFRLSDPAGTISAVFPMDNDSGGFDTVLPHVVLSQPTLPWARYPTLTPPVPALAPGTDTDIDVPTWLAVLLLDDSDVAAYPSLVLDPVTATVGDLFPPTVQPGSTLGTAYSSVSGSTPQEALEPDQSVTDPIQVIDIPLTLFADIAPTLADLALSAHVRQVCVDDKPLTAGAPEPEESIGTFAVVVGNRLPQDGSHSRAYLVSLENLELFLAANDDGRSVAGSGIDKTRSLRLPVLFRWTFFSTGSPATFVSALESLNGRDPDGDDALNTNVRISVEGASGVLATAFAKGYAPLDHDLRSGGATVSWYRGPLATTTSAEPVLALPIPSADAVLAFDPTTGMLDVSLAAAWMLGRLLGLSDTTFATALYAWRQGLSRTVVDSAEAALVAELFGTAGTAPALGQGAPAARQSLLRHSLALLRDMDRGR